ncbi:MAG: type VI secretion system tip protein VgrG, partial [Acidobacteria bacterium]
MGWTTQRGRLLAIDTPFENDFLLIQKIRVNEGISKLFEIELELLHEENESDYASFEINPLEILGEVITIRISQKDGVERYFNGIVQQFSQGERDTRFSKYSAKVVPGIWKLTQNVQSRIFQHMTVPEILRKIFEGFQVVFELRETYEPRNYCVQYRESDFDFASRLMEEEGIYYYFEHL